MSESPKAGARCHCGRGTLRLADWFARDGRPWLAYECRACGDRREKAVCSWPTHLYEVGGDSGAKGPD